MNLKLQPAEWCSLAFAVLVGHGFLLREWYFPSGYDAAHYAQMGGEIFENGLFQQASDFRTYGYPLVLSFVHRAAPALGLAFTVVLFELQLILYGAACFFFRAALARSAPRAARIAFCGMLLNFYVLIYASQSLTESLSLSLLVIAAGCWLMLARKDAGLLPLVAGSLVAGFSVMVRPANVFMVVAWIIGVVIVGLRKRIALPHALMAGACVAAALALPAVPQLANNVRHFGKWTPLVVRDLGTMQQIWGIRNIKYATALAPVLVEPIYYRNPFFPGTQLDKASPWRWYLDYPGRGIATLALHVFNMLDQDLLFSYSRDLDPWYRIPLGVINHAAVALGLIGLVLLGRRTFKDRIPGAYDASLALLALIGANLAIYAWTAVEMRFGSALLLVLFPFAGDAAMRVAQGARVRTIVGTAVGVALYIVFALLLSSWVREQAPPIRNAVMATTAGAARHGGAEFPHGVSRLVQSPPAAPAAGRP